MQNCHLVLPNNNLPDTSRDFFKYANNHYQQHTRGTYSKINIPHVKTTHYSLQSIKCKAVKDWDEIQKELI